MPHLNSFSFIFKLCLRTHFFKIYIYLEISKSTLLSTPLFFILAHFCHSVFCLLMLIFIGWLAIGLFVAALSSLSSCPHREMCTNPIMWCWQSWRREVWGKTFTYICSFQSFGEKGKYFNFSVLEGRFIKASNIVRRRLSQTTQTNGTSLLHCQSPQAMFLTAILCFILFWN